MNASEPMNETQMVKSVCMLCFMVCGIDAYLKDGVLLRVEGMKEHIATQGALCPRGYHLPDYVYSPDRLKFPLIRDKAGAFRRATWDEAIEFVAGGLRKIRGECGPESVAVTVGSIGAENILISAFAQRWRAAFGTPNFFSIEAHCFRSRIMARLFTFGNYPLSDPDHAECVVLWGHNPDASEPPVAARLHRLVDQGLTVIVIDPRKIPLAKKGIYVPVRPGTDAALALSMINVIINEGLYDREFVEKRTLGFDELRDHAKGYPPEKAAAVCGVPASDIYRISRIYAGAKGASIEQGINSLDQHINGFQNSRVLAILQAITGNYNRPGGWCRNPFMRLSDLRMPVEGKPIGAREYPIFHSFWGMTSPYGQQMLLPDAILTQKPYPIKALLVSGGNPAAAWPDAEKVNTAFKKLDLLVVMDLFMTETAKLAHVVLPVCSSVETLGLAYNYGLTMGIPYAMLSRKLIDPIGESKPDWWIYSRLGREMGQAEHFPWDSDEEVVAHMLKPSGFTLKQLMEDFPHGVMFGTRSYEPEEKFRTPSGKIELHSRSLAALGQDPLPVHKEPTQSPFRNPELAEKYPHILVTGVRIPEYTHWQMKSITPLRSLAPDPVAWLHPATAADSGVRNGDMMIVETRRSAIRVKATTTEDMMPGVIGLAHGWEEAVNANLLTELDDRDPVTGYSEFRNLACRIRRETEREDPLFGEEKGRP